MNKSVMFGEVKALDGTSEWGEFEVILSAPTLDRDGEIIDAKAFDPLPDHITFDIDHGMSVATTVGSGTPRYDGDVLKVKGTYSRDELGQRVRNLVNDGHIRTTSVAFMAPKREVKDGVPHVTKAELLNGAFVPIPSNRDALVLVGKSLKLSEAVPTKAIAGSMEERRDKIREAIRTANSEAWWTNVVATFDDSVVYTVESRDGDATYQASYSIGDDGTVSLGTAEAVTVAEVIQPAKSITTDPKTEAAGVAATKALTPPGSPLAEVAQARRAIQRIEADLLLID